MNTNIKRLCIVVLASIVLSQSQAQFTDASFGGGIGFGGTLGHTQLKD